MQTRYAIRPTSAAVYYLGDQSQAAATITNLSLGGARFSTAGPPREGEEVLIRFAGNGETFEARGVIRWRNQTEPDCWEAGCEFDPPLDQEVLRNSGLQATPERRPTTHRATIRREAAPNYPYSVEVRNCSAGGLCVLSDGILRPGENAILQVGEGRSVRQFLVRLQWTRTAAAESLIGCRFESPEDAIQLRRALGMEAQASESATKLVAGHWVVLVAGLILVVGAVVLSTVR